MIAVRSAGVLPPSAKRPGDSIGRSTHFRRWVGTGPPLLVVAAGPYAGEGFDCPALDKTTAEGHDYLDERTGVLSAMLAKRAPGYTGLGFSDPRRVALTPSASTDS